MKKNVLEVLRKANAQNITLEIDNGSLNLKSESETIDSDLIQEIKNNKNGIIKYLNKYQSRNLSRAIERPIVPHDYTKDSLERIPLSFSQERMWFLDQLHGSLEYHIPLAFQLKGVLKTAILEASFKEIVNRHHVLRTVIKSKDGVPYQQVIPVDNWALESVELSATSNLKESIKKSVEEPFDLSEDYTLRVTLFSIDKETHIVLGVFHHIASDGWSNNILLQDFKSLYELKHTDLNATLKPMNLQYSDFAIWQRTHLESELLDMQLAYWEEELSGAETLALPTDFTRPTVQSNAGASLNFKLDSLLSTQLNDLCKTEGVTLFMLLLSAFNILLSKYTGQDDITVGTPIANRTQKELEALIGFFINTLALRSDLSGNPTFLHLLEQVRETTLSAYHNQGAPFEKVVERVVKTRDMSMHPLFQVMFVLQNASDKNENLALGNVALSPFEDDETMGTSKFDLTLTISEELDTISYNIEYCTDLFKEETIVSIASNFEVLLRSICTDPSASIHDLSMLKEKEKNQVLKLFNATEAEYPSGKTVIGLFSEQVLKTPEAMALASGEYCISYQELDELSNQFAKHLQATYTVTEGDFIGLMMDRTQWSVISMLGIVKAGAIYVPIDQGYPAARKQFIIEDANLKLLVVASKKVLTDLETVVPVLDVMSEKSVLTTLSTSFTPLLRGPSDLVYVMYTSGTTGKPKGVKVMHKNIVKLAVETKPIAVLQTDKVLQWSNLAFDGSTYDIYSSLLNGASLHFIDRETASDPRQLAKEIIDNELTVAFMTTALFNSFVDYDLSALKYLRKLLFGGQQASISHVQKAYEEVGPDTLIHVYGPTETTVYATYFPINSKPKKNVPIGYPLSNTSVYILNESLHPLGLGMVGELCIAGEGVAAGYLNREEITNEKFIKSPYAKINGHLTLYRTGDLARWSSDGAIEFIGRKDDQVKIRGYRVELGDVAHAIQELAEVRQCFVVAKEEGNGNKCLVGYVVGVDLEFNKIHIQERLRSKLPEYMIPQLWVNLEEFPLTANGKIDKKKLPEVVVSEQSSAAYVAPRNNVEQQLVLIWQALLGAEKIGIYDNFFELGGHSLLATRLISMVRKEMQIEMPIARVFAYPTIAELALHIQTLPKGLKLPKITVQEKAGKIPLSFGQERLWFLDELQGSQEYHLPTVIRLSGALNPKILEASFKGIVARHEVLRTVIKSDDGQGYQEVISAESWTMEQDVVKDIPSLDLILGTFTRQPFDLTKDFMFRAKLYQIGTEEYLLAAVFHHIASDGWSESVLIDELTAHYEALERDEKIELPPLDIQYADYAIWQRTHFEGAFLDEQMAYWEEQLRGVEPVAIPTDYARPAIQSNHGDSISFSIDAELTHAIKQVGKSEDVTLFMLLSSVFKVLLTKYSGQEDICIGTPIANRTQQELEGLIGFFVNTLVLRSDLGGDPKFSELLQRVKETTIAAYDHQLVPFEKIVDKVVTTRDMSMSPLVQIMFVLQNNPDNSETLKFGDVALSKYKEEKDNSSKYDLRFTAGEYEDQLSFNLEYCTALFKEETAYRIIDHFIELLRSIVKNPQERIGNLKMFTKEEGDILLQKFNNTLVPYPSEKSVVQLFEEQVSKTPHKKAVFFENTVLTYAELNRKANCLAHHLKEHFQIETGDHVGLMMDTSELSIVCFLGVLKAGAAYVPIDSTYPESRKAFIIEDTDLKLLVTGSENILDVVEFNTPIFSIDIELDTLLKNETYCKNPANPITPEHGAYVMYTSGSTGKPKGVQVVHRNIVKLATERAAISIQEEDRVLQWSNLSFDGSTYDIYASLLNGASLYLITREVAADPEKLSLHMKENELTVVFMTTALFNSFVDYDLEALTQMKKILFGGQHVSLVHVNKAFEVMGPNKLIHVYGPTETTVYATYFVIDEKQENAVPIGHPLSNTSIYIVNNSGELAGIGVVGEIYIAGAGVSNGYLNRVDLTNEKFIADSFNDQIATKMYRTGDLARWLPNGEIVFMGRKDDQVKIRGYRIELGEIESNVLASHPGIKSCCVVAKEDANGNKRLIGYMVPENDTFDKSVIKDQLRNQLPDYMIPQLWVEMERLPLNRSGKVDKKSLPDPAVSELNTVAYVAPRDEMEEKLAATFQDLLGIEKAGINDNFFELGGDSIITIQVVSRLKRLGYLIRPRDVFEHQTIAGLAKVILTEGKTVITGEQGVLSGESPMLPVQQRYFKTLHKTHSHFNQSVLLSIDKKIDLLHLKKAIKALVSHHDALRFSYQQKEGTWLQVYTDFEGTFEVFNTAKTSLENEADSITEICNKAQQSLSLETGEIFKAVCIETEDDPKNRLFLVAHHLVIDSVSWRILFDDLEHVLKSLNTGSPIEMGVKGSSFREWVAALTTYAISNVVAMQRTYWSDIASSYKALPVDMEFNETTRRDVASYDIEMNPETTSLLLKAVNRTYATEIDDILLSCVAYTIGDWSGHSKIVVGLEGHGREDLLKDIDINNTVGWFTNLYPIALSTKLDNNWGTLIKSTKENLRSIPQKGMGYGALRYLHPSQEIREHLSALNFDVIFNYLGQFDNISGTVDTMDVAEEDRGVEIGDDCPFESKLEITGAVADQKLRLTWCYSSHQYKAATIVELADSYLENLHAIIEHCIEKENREFTPSDYDLGNEVKTEDLDAFITTLNEEVTEGDDILEF